MFSMCRLASSPRGGTNYLMGIVAVALLVGAAPSRLGAQSSLVDEINPMGHSRDGLHLYNVSAFAGWESVLSPQGGFFLPYNDVKGDEMAGVGTSLGWSRHGAKSNFSMVYSANYLRMFRHSSLSALGQSLALDGSRRLSRKWTVNLGLNSAVSTYDQMLFTPTILSQVTDAPGTFDDLAAAVLAGKYNNDQLASLLTGVPVIESPARTLFFGNRVFITSLFTSLSYAHSQRLSISFSSSASRMQHLESGSQRELAQDVFLVPRSIAGTASVDVSYAVTPRTQVGVSMSASRGFSQLAEAYVTSASAFVGRTMGRHWFMQVHGGAATSISITNKQSPYRGPSGARPVVGGNVGYKRRAHSFVVAADRTMSQVYGAGAADSSIINGAWRWSPPGRSWGLETNYSRQQFSGGTYRDVHGWRAGCGLSRRLGEHYTLQTEYTYGAFSSSNPQWPYQSAQHAVRLSFMWAPQARERR